MKLTKIFYGNQYVTKFNCDGSKKTLFQRIKAKVRRILILTIKGYAVLAVVGLLIFIGGELRPKTLYAVQEKIVPVVIEAPVLERIAKCESGGNHFGKSGQVLAVGNVNKSVDVGRYQINLSVWGKVATDMGLNLFEEADNKEFAQYLYSHFGTEPWIHSKHCWNK